MERIMQLGGEEEVALQKLDDCIEPYMDKYGFDKMNTVSVKITIN